MKVKNVHIQNFKRFTDLTIEGIPETAKMVVLVGPNGCGKTSVFEAFNSLYKGFCAPKNGNYVGNFPSDYIFNYRNIYKDPDIHNPYGFQDKSNINYCKINDYRNENTVSIHISSNLKSLIDYGEDRVKIPNKYIMHFRTAYRNDPDFSLNKLENNEQAHSLTFIDNDQRVMRNYQKILLKTIDGIYLEENNCKTVEYLRNELIGKLQQSMKNIFEDLILNNIQSPLKEGSFYFKKGIVDNYHYKNLSSGEKAVFDLLLDLIVNLDDYQDSLFFIDEPEAHIHTKLQGQVVEEIYNLISENSQLWITTHSLGVMTKAKELASKNPERVVFLDFDGHDFDQQVTITPSPIDRIVWQKFMSVALDGLEEKLAPEIIVLCEGSFKGTKRFNFDAEIYTKIFQDNYRNITFISGGASEDLLQESKEFKMLSLLLNKQSKIVRLIDRDDHSDEEVIDLQAQEIFTSSRRHIESYLFDDELIQQLVIQENKQELLGQALTIKETALKNSIARGNAKDDVKSAAGEIFTGLKKLLGLTRCGNKTDPFMKNTMLPLITPETEVYKEMEREIIQPILKASGH
ncbi:ATP-binding protein [Commensalibacter papalotli (ex Botero et al. 2024)]|uniref:Contains P-loop ATPase and TOPRIM domains (YbjD) n=1 Tax=Commensalibacter papalotli (ex Botero et al. 2024) TaxID=2972766 RepID=A0ABM9HKP4_9PROT|nr:ATP-binding protein [Commensalibacter papalotli (ex Botero et al. 2024)]CAI3929814.1 Predicted ATP-dependent endonuclease of the OLD family [Commensalibacter papalotli (ex Botero et al. 2024)]